MEEKEEEAEEDGDSIEDLMIFDFDSEDFSDEEIIPLPQSLPEHKETVIFVDWDDTLIFSTYIDKNRDLFPPIGPLREKEALEIDEIDRVSTLLLAKLKTLGKVFIVTNAQEGWVETCSNRWFQLFPGVLGSIRVISARTLHQRVDDYYDDQTVMPGVLERWKSTVFQDIAMEDEKTSHFIGLGDRCCDRTALRSLMEFPLILHRTPKVKNIKFSEQPTPKQLIEQIKLLTSTIEKLHHEPSHLDYQLTIDIVLN